MAPTVLRQQIIPWFFANSYTLYDKICILLPRDTKFIARREIMQIFNSIINMIHSVSISK